MDLVTYIFIVAGLLYAPIYYYRQWVDIKFDLIESKTYLTRVDRIADLLGDAVIYGSCLFAVVFNDPHGLLVVMILGPPAKCLLLLYQIATSKIPLHLAIFGLVSAIAGISFSLVIAILYFY